MMTPDTVVEAYVNDVARRLPRAKRNDVALELQALLREELAGKADESGRVADEAMALELVRAFGSPEEVAERYRPAAFTIVPATRSRKFAAIAFGGVALQWLITLPAALLKEPGREAVALGHWWLTYGMGALWWPGFMVTAAIFAGWARHRWPPAQTTTWRPRGDNDRINRTAWAIGGVAATAGIAMVTSAEWLFTQFLSPQAGEAFAFDPDFLPVGGAVVVALWSCTALGSAIVFVEGRWRPLTRNIGLALDTMWFLALTWLATGPRIYLKPVTDEAAKGSISLLALVVLLDLAWKIYRRVQRPRADAALATIAKS
jgi:hypothetical protein